MKESENRWWRYIDSSPGCAISIPRLVRGFFHASEKGYVTLARLLLRYSKGLRQVDDVPLTSLFKAVKAGHRELVELLFDQGITLCEELYALLITLAKANNRRLIRLILSIGQDLQPLGYWAHCTLIKAALDGRADIVEVFVDRGLVDTTAT